MGWGADFSTSLHARDEVLPEQVLPDPGIFKSSSLWIVRALGGKGMVGAGKAIDLVHGRRPPGGIVLDMDSSVSPTHDEQENSVWNGHYACACYHPLFVFKDNCVIASIASVG